MESKFRNKEISIRFTIKSIKLSCVINNATKLDKILWFFAKPYYNYQFKKAIRNDTKRIIKEGLEKFFKENE